MNSAIFSNRLSELSDRSDPGEEYSIVPDNYEPGQTRFIIVTGRVISGLGKGVFSAGLATLLEERGYITNLIKMSNVSQSNIGINIHRYLSQFQ